MYFKGLAKSGMYKDACRGEFDVPIKKSPVRALCCYDIYEVKYLKKPFSEWRVLYETDKIADIKDMSIENVGFVFVTGFGMSVAAF